MPLRNAKQFHGFTMETLNGKAGTIKEILFDDEQWMIRYFVVETSGWLSNSEILMASMSVGSVDWDSQTIHANLTQEQIKDNPGISVTRPILRVQEVEFLNHYGYAHYWTGLTTGVPAAEASASGPPSGDTSNAQRPDAAPDPGQDASNLHSTVDLIGSAIRTTDELDGHVVDVRFEDTTWAIQSLVIDARNWSPGKNVLVAPSSVEYMNWVEGEVVLAMTRKELEACPQS